MDYEFKDESEDTGRPIRWGRRKKLGIINKITSLCVIRDRNKHITWQRLFKQASKKDFKQTTRHSIPSMSTKRPLILIISNFSISRNYAWIKNCIEAECGIVEQLELLKPEGAHGSVRVKFYTHIQLIIAKAHLNNKEIDGVKLVVIDEHRENNPTLPPEHKRNTISYLDVWEDDPQGLYGFRTEFLKALNITPPITKWVHVINFRCDKSELKEVMEMAGQVLACSIEHGLFKFAKVMYSHPLEAVQAVSMLNGRIFYGQCLGVTIDNQSDDTALPQGLIDVGPGLGKNGKPVRNIVQQYDKFVKKQSTQINSLLFTGSDDFSDENDHICNKLEEKHAENLSPHDKKDWDITDENDEIQSGNITSCATRPVASQNNQPLLPQNLVPNPINISHAPMKDLEDRITGLEMDVPLFSSQNHLPPHAINPMSAPGGFSGCPPEAGNTSFVRVPSLPSEAVFNSPVCLSNYSPENPVNSFIGLTNFPPDTAINSSVSMPSFPPVGTAPQTMLQNTNMHWNVLPQPIFLAQNSIIEPNMAFNSPVPCMNMRGNNLVKLIPRLPLAPSQIRPQGPRESSELPHINFAQNPEPVLFRPRPTSLAPTLNTGPTIYPFIPHFTWEGNAQSVSNPGMYFSRTGISNTVILNNLPPCSYEVLLDKLSKCGQVMSVKWQHSRCVVVTFATAEQAEKCIQMYNGFTTGGSVLNVSFA